MKILNRIFCHYKKQSILLENNKQEALHANAQMVYVILILGALIFGSYIPIALFNMSYKPLLFNYIVQLIAVLICIFFFKKIQKYISASGILYAICSFVIAYFTYSSAYITPDYSGVVILFILLQLPIIILDKSWRINLFTILVVILYITFAVPNKIEKIQLDECLNCILFGVLGMALGDNLRAIRLENFELKRQSLLREKTDYLTGLHNRKSLFDTLTDMASHHLPIGLIILDIDNFKLYNDTYGHQGGDECLRRIGAFFNEFAIRRNISFYRYGGEEFVAITKGFTSTQLQDLCHEINQCVENLKMPHKASPYSVVTVSIGFSLSHDITTSNYKLLLSQADAAMYTAKKEGRNRSMEYSENMTISPEPNFY